MKPIKRSTLIKGVLLAVYVTCIGLVYWYAHSHHLGVRELGALARNAVRDAGWFGPFMVMGLYSLQAIIPFPTAALAIISGTSYGPIWGLLIALLGMNLSGVLHFWIGRYFGQHFVSAHETGWVKKYDDKLKGRGFFAVLVLRLLGFPFDYTSLACGMTQMSFRQYALATFFGSLPHVVVFVELGNAFRRPGTWPVVALLVVVSLLLAVAFRYSPIGRSMFDRPKADS